MHLTHRTKLPCAHADGHKGQCNSKVALARKDAVRYRVILNRMRAIKVERGCADCGYKEHPAALDFDHRPGTVKLFNVGNFTTHGSWRRVEEEIAKCDVRCANCHRIVTELRREANRAKLGDGSEE